MVKMNMKNMFCKHECVTYVNKIYDMTLVKHETRIWFLGLNEYDNNDLNLVVTGDIVVARP